MLKRACPVCKSTKQIVIQNIQMNIPKDYHLPDNYDVVECTDCGMVYADTSATLEDYDWYYTHFNFYGDDSKDDNSRRYEWMEELLEKYLTKDSLMLELGAGNGRYSMALKKHGYTGVTATDPSDESVQRLQDAGVEAYVTNIYSEVLEREKEKYDAVFLFEVAEHLLAPRRGIANIACLLRYFMVSVPDYSMIADDMCSIPNYFNLEHINYFSEDSLDTLMAQFKLVRMDQKRIGGDLVQVYQKVSDKIPFHRDEQTAAAIRQYLNRQHVRQAQIKERIDQLQKQDRELIIWGTGSYVLQRSLESVRFWDLLIITGLSREGRCMDVRFMHRIICRISSIWWSSVPCFTVNRSDSSWRICIHKMKL